MPELCYQKHLFFCINQKAEGKPCTAYSTGRASETFINKRDG